MGLYIHSPIRLQGVVLNYLSTGTMLLFTFMIKWKTLEEENVSYFRSLFYNSYLRSDEDNVSVRIVCVRSRLEKTSVPNTRRTRQLLETLNEIVYYRYRLIRKYILYLK
jgi:hypothetical protein